MPLEKWFEVEEEQLGAATNKMSQDRNDPEAVLEMFGSLVAFSKREEAATLAESMIQRFPENIDIQMSVGAWHEREGRGQKADECFEAGFRADPDHPGPRRAVGIGKIEQGRLQEAAELLGTFRHPSEYYDPAIFFMLASAHQKADDHDAALDEYAELGENHPELLKDKDFRKMVITSEKALGESESMLPPISIFERGWFWTLVITGAIAGFVVWAIYN